MDCLMLTSTVGENFVEPIQHCFLILIPQAPTEQSDHAPHENLSIQDHRWLLWILNQWGIHKDN